MACEEGMVQFICLFPSILQTQNHSEIKDFAAFTENNGTKGPFYFEMYFPKEVQALVQY